MTEGEDFAVQVEEKLNTMIGELTHAQIGFGADGEIVSVLLITGKDEG